MPASPYSAIRLRREQRHMKLTGLGYASYPEYLRSPHWASKRAEFYASDQPQDCICGDTDRIQLHHLTYARVGAERLIDLTPLCPTCHAMIHALERRGEVGLDFSGFVNAERAKRYAAAQESLAQRRQADAPPTLEARLAISRKRFRYGLAVYRRFAEPRGVNIDSDLRCILRRLDAVDAALLA